MTDDTIYLDHAATTPLEPEVLDAMMPWLAERYASASTHYTAGRQAAQAVEEARERVARLIGAAAEEIYFTSGGTESNNWALLGAAAQARGAGAVVTSAIEHHSVLEPCRALERQGRRVKIIGVDGDGIVKMDELAEALSESPRLLCLMHANNEIGSIQPVEEAGRLAREGEVHFHVDAVQTVGHCPVDVGDIGCDTLAMSAHKLGGTKGMGALYLRDGVRLENLVYGGAQEDGLRAGTQNVAAIVGFGKAAELAQVRLEEEAARLSALRDELIRGIEARIPGVQLNGHRTHRLPGNVNFSFEGVASDDLLLRLDLAGVCASAGSACTSDSLEPSHVLLALGLSPEQAHGALRLTLGRGNDGSEIARTLDLLEDMIALLRE